MDERYENHMGTCRYVYFIGFSSFDDISSDYEYQLGVYQQNLVFFDFNLYNRLCCLLCYHNIGRI